MKSILKLLALAAIVLSSNLVLAESNSILNAKAITNSMKYVKGLGGDLEKITIGVIYDPDIPISKSEAMEFDIEVSNLSTAKKPNIRLLTIDEFKNHAKIDSIFIPHGMKKHYEQIYKISKEEYIFSTSSDIECVKNKCCIMGVENNQKIEIYLNENTLRDVGFDVDSAFKFIVKKV